MKKFDSINVIPFIDIMLVLLAIVLATASFISQQKIEVNVPQSQSKTPVEQKDLTEVIAITNDGNYFYQDKPTTLVELDNTLSKLNKDTQLTIRIDATSDFQQFVNVTDILSKYGLKKVTVVTEKISATLSGSAPTTTESTQ